MVFLNAEKKRQTVFKLSSNYFTKPARKPGLYRGKLYQFCLPLNNADQNLFSPIRDEAIKHFKKNKIYWHNSAYPNMPSNHLCSSQVFCINFLFPFINNPDSLKKLLSPAIPNIENILKVEKDSYISFEWIGKHNYLKEMNPISSKRKRGIGTTSIDAAILFEDTSKKKNLLLIEWKYTEAYSNQNIRFSNRGQDRLSSFSHLLKGYDSVFNNNVLKDVNNLMSSSFYQLFRQTLLTKSILKHSPEYDNVLILYLYSESNYDLLKISDNKMSKIDNNIFKLWKKILVDPSCFHYCSIDKLFNNFNKKNNDSYEPWSQYISDRYNI